MKEGLVKLPLEELHGLLKLPKDTKVEYIFITNDDLEEQTFTVRISGDGLPRACGGRVPGGKLKRLSLVYQSCLSNTRLIRIDVSK